MSPAMWPARTHVPFSRPSRARRQFGVMGVLIRWFHHRLISRVPPALNPGWCRMAEGASLCLGRDRVCNAMPWNSVLRVFTGSETIPHGFDTSLVALPSRVQHEKPGTLALADASAARSRIHWRHPPKHGRPGAAVGGTGDHIHIAAGLRATHCLADVMREVKSESSRWIHEELRVAGFAWQEGYGAFTFAAPVWRPCGPMC